jgi:hypothetical protein
MIFCLFCLFVFCELLSHLFYLCVNRSLTNECCFLTRMYMTRFLVQDLTECNVPVEFVRNIVYLARLSLQCRVTSAPVFILVFYVLRLFVVELFCCTRQSGSVLKAKITSCFHR